MKKIIALAVIAAFSAGPVLACDAMKGGDSYHKSDTKASVQTDRKAKSAKAAKAVKPLAESKTQDKKI